MPQQAKRNLDAEPPSFVSSAAGNADLGVHLRTNGPTSYLAAESLERPLEFPRSNWQRLGMIAGIAVVISVIIIVFYNVTVSSNIASQHSLVTEAINRDVALDLPNLQSYVGKTNDEMYKQFDKDGYTIYDNTNEEDEEVNGFDVFKLASDVSADDAAKAYSTGIENLDDAEAAKYLAGSWRFLVSRSDGAELRVRYADFSSKDATAAIKSALDAEGFEGDIAEIAEDSMGNTNLSGTFKKDKKEYDYTISACDLSQVYDIDGAPDGAQFVGIRVTEAS